MRRDFSDPAVRPEPGARAIPGAVEARPEVGLARPAGDVVLEVRNLQTRFRHEGRVVTAVDEVSFCLRRGRVLAIVGESGCGKSVTAYSILRLVQKPGRIEAGRVVLHPRGRPALELTSLPEDSYALHDVRGGLIGMIFQEPAAALSPLHTIGSQIIESIRLHHPVSRAEARRQAIDMLRKVGIPAPERRIEQYPHELSGGMRQRAVIAMALVCRPEVLIADEPTTALDVTLQAQILGLIKRLQREIGCSVLLITHNMAVVAQMADEVAVMYLGRIVELGPVRQVLKSPRHPYTIGLMQAVPGADGRRARLSSIGGGVPPPGRIPPGCAFHPRCPWRRPGLCDADVPVLRPVAGRAVACARAGEIAYPVSG